MPAATQIVVRPRRIVIPGGSGHIGSIVARHFHSRGHGVTVLSRKVFDAPWRVTTWDGVHVDRWAEELDGADLVLNLAGRSVDCRYTAENRREILESRVLSTRVLGEAIGRLTDPPRVWMNAGTATIYRHALDREMDEVGGELGGNEPNAPEEWRFSIDVAKRWEEEFFAARTGHTRKLVLRSAMVMSPARGGPFDVLLRLVRFGLGGAAASGGQFMSWVHEFDFLRAIDFLLASEGIGGVVNIAAPGPLPNREFMKVLRNAYGMRFGLAATEWLLELGAVLLRTETELILKSRRVVPGRLQASGFRFQFSDWMGAAEELVERWRLRRAGRANEAAVPQRVA